MWSEVTFFWKESYSAFSIHLHREVDLNTFLPALPMKIRNSKLVNSIRFRTREFMLYEAPKCFVLYISIIFPTSSNIFWLIHVFVI